MQYKINYDWLHCSNKELVRELEEKENFFAQIAERIMRCPHCKKGHFFLEHDDREYSSDAWWMCDNCLECDGTPSKLREKMIEEIAQYGIDEYWDYSIYYYIQEFEYQEPRTYREDEQKTREFNAEEWDKEEHHPPYDCEQAETLTWEEFVEREIRGHIDCLDKAIERAKKYKMLKHFFKENNND